MRIDVGRKVHYVAHGTPIREDGTQAFPAACRAAIITEVEEDPQPGFGAYRVGLCVLNPTGLFFHSLAAGGCAPEDPGKMVGGTWHAHYDDRPCGGLGPS